MLPKFIKWMTVASFAVIAVSLFTDHFNWMTVVASIWIAAWTVLFGLDVITLK